MAEQSSAVRLPAPAIRLLDTVIQTANHKTQADAFRRLPLTRWAALFAVLLGLVAQTFHTHVASPDDGFSGNKTHALVASQNSELCPLCIAAHTANTVPTIWAIALSGKLESVSFVRVETLHAIQPAFTHFSRPPPARLL